MATSLMQSRTSSIQNSPRINTSSQYIQTPIFQQEMQTGVGFSPKIDSIAIGKSRQTDIMQGVNLLKEEQSLPISSKLTIYSRSGHIVQRFSPGTKVLSLPKSVEIASIVVVDSNGAIIPFSYVPEANMGIALTDRSTGEKVEASVVKEGEAINGKILSLGPDNVMLMTGNQITNIREYDRVVVGINEDVTRPRLVLERDSTAFTISYLLSSIAWTCIGTALIDNINNIMYLRLAGNITNNTESDIRAQTVLVSGEVYQYRRRQNTYAEKESYAPRALMAQSVAPMTSPKAQSSMLEDYVKYEVGDRLVRNQDIAELGTWQIPIIKLYVHETNDNDKVSFGYRFVAPGFVPSCSLNVYSIDSNKALDSYLGSNEIEESQKNDEVDIILGESTMLQCKSLVVISNDYIVEDENTMRQYKLPLNTIHQHTVDDRRWHIITEDLKVDITNHNDRPVSLVLKHFVGDKFLVDIRCQAYKDRKNGFIEWYFEVPPKISSEPRKDKFSCQILTASYY